MQQGVLLVPFTSMMHLAQCWEKFQVILGNTGHLHSQEVKPWTMDHGPNILSRIKSLLSTS